MKFFTENRNTTDRWGNTQEITVVRWGRVVACAIVALFIIITLLNSFTVIPSGYTGVRTTFGQIDQDVVPNGFCMKIPYVQSVQKVNNKQQEITFEDQVWGETSERTVVYMADVTVTYRINSDYSVWLYTNVSDYKQNALPQTLVASALKASMVKLNSTQVTNRGMIEPLCVETLQEAINTKYGGEQVITIVNVNINDMDFETSYNEAIAAKQVAQMEYEKQQIQNQTEIEKASAAAEQKRIQAQAEADTKLIAAQAEADAITVVAEAQADANEKLAGSLTDNLIEHEKIEKWNGQLPTVSGSDALISITP